MAGNCGFIVQSIGILSKEVYLPDIFQKYQGDDFKIWQLKTEYSKYYNLDTERDKLERLVVDGRPLMTTHFKDCQIIFAKYDITVSGSSVEVWNCAVYLGPGITNDDYKLPCEYMLIYSKKIAQTMLDWLSEIEESLPANNNIYNIFTQKKY